MSVYRHRSKKKKAVLTLAVLAAAILVMVLFALWVTSLGVSGDTTTLICFGAGILIGMPIGPFLYETWRD